jgi:hypothetical protein
MSKELLVGLTGPAGCGKDTVANMMTKEGFTRYTLALPLKSGLQAMLGIPLEIWDDRVAKEQPLDWLGKSPRQLAQTLGTEWGRICVDQDLWVKLMLRRWQWLRSGSNPRMVVTDVRFNNEAKAIIEAGGTVWRVQRPTVAFVAEHVSENGVDSQFVTGVVKNEGDIDALAVTVAHWIPFITQRYGR